MEWVEMTCMFSFHANLMKINPFQICFPVILFHSTLPDISSGRKSKHMEIDHAPKSMAWKPDPIW